MIAFMVAGTASGVGKTTVALAPDGGVAESEAFACSRSNADRTFWMQATIARYAHGRPRNLDTRMLDDSANRAIFTHASRDADGLGLWKA